MFQASRTKVPLLLSCIGAVLAFTGIASAQESPTPQPTTTTIEMPRAQNFEVGVFTGGSFFKQKRDPLDTEMLPSGLVGGWLAENPWRYVGIEQNFTYMQNDLRFHQVFDPSAGVQSFTLSQRIIQFQNKLVVHFTPKTSSVRPYLTAGIGLESFEPTQSAKNTVNLPSNAGLTAQTLGDSNVLGFVYGGGLKVRLTEHFGLRAEALGLLSQQPHYSLAQTGVPPQIYIPSGGLLNGLQITAGMMFIFGGKQEITLTVPPAFTRVVISPAQPAAVCAGTPVNFTGTVENVTPNHTPTLRWTVDGQNAGSGPTFTYTPTGSGSHTVVLTAVDNISPLELHSASATVSSTQHTGPSITANADKTDLQLGDKAMLYPHPTAGACPGNLTVAWSVTEGTVTGTDPATYDSTSVTFDPNATGPQTKQVTATATVTDDKGGTASAPVMLNISKQGIQMVRQDDIVFPTSNSRVNNCGKRILIDQVYPALTSGQYSNFDVVLIGHAGNEPPPPKKRGKKAAAAPTSVDLARERAENVAAVLSSGDGICPKPGIDLSRIKIATVGPNQGPDVRSACIGSTADKERKGFKIDTSDSLKDQRVEIWIVPKGSSAMPDGASGAQTAPDSIKSLGCPK